MDSEEIVCWLNVEKYYKGNSELIKKFKGIMENGRCPFCCENIRNEGYNFIAETNHWHVVENPYPYKGSTLHLLIIPKRHVISLQNLYCEEWAQMAETISIISKKYPFLAKGYGLAVRQGEVGGATLLHLHWHLIAPKVESKTGRIVVNFGIG